MKLIIKLFPEIIIKSSGVRRRFSMILRSNISSCLKRVTSEFTTVLFWDKIEVNLKNDSYREEIIEALQKIPGVEFFLEVDEYNFSTKEDISDLVLPFFRDKISNKTFVVRVKRAGKHDFSSLELERSLGSVLLENSSNSKVDLHNPEITINLEVKNNKLYVVKNRYAGLSGYPVGTQDKVVSLISGGFDSGVSTFMMIKKGCLVDYMFFNLGGLAHEVGVKQISYFIWKNYSQSYGANFITVDFEQVVAEILTKINHKYRGVVLKRMMMRVADSLSQKTGYKAIITGESVAQVSSQTLTNLGVIDKISDTLILRPLTAFDKTDIINYCKKIGTEYFSATMPEYCGVISDKPSTAVDLYKLEEDEKNFDFSILKKSINDIKVIKMTNIPDSIEEITTAEIVSKPNKDDIIIDIREENIIKRSPTNFDCETMQIPFYEINNSFPDLDQTRNYLLYCEKGVMSNLHAMSLNTKGFTNVKVIRI